MHDLLPSHLPSSQEAVGAESPSISMLVLYLSSTPSLNTGVAQLHSEKTRANPSSQISLCFTGDFLWKTMY